MNTASSTSSFDMKEWVGALERVEDSTAALAAVAAANGAFVEKESPPSMFLKYAKGDWTSAAQRFAYYWQERADVFPTTFLQPLEECLAALPEQHLMWLQEDVAILLPGKDKEGRRVLLASPYKGPEAVRLCRFVAMQQLMQEQREYKDESEWPSMVLIRVADPMVQFDIRAAKLSQHFFQNCFPVSFNQVRLVCAGRKSHIKNTILPMAFGGLGKDLSSRCKAHVDTELTRMQIHLSDILKPHQLPPWLGGTWNRQVESEQQQQKQPPNEDLLSLILPLVEDIADDDLEVEIRGVLVGDHAGAKAEEEEEEKKSMDDDETMILCLADTIRATRRTARRQWRRQQEQLETKTQLVFGVASLLLDEMPGSRIADLLQDNLADEILRDLWVSSQQTATNRTSSELTEATNAKDGVDRVVGSILQIHQDPSQQHKKDPKGPIQETQLSEVHSKFRSALKLLSLLQQDSRSASNPLRNQEQLALVCELVELPFSQRETSHLSAECKLERLADLLIQEPLQATADIPEWLVNAVAAS